MARAPRRPAAQPGDMNTPPAVKETPTEAMGIVGLQRTGGFVWEEFHRDLRGANAMRVYREMSDNE